MSALSIGLSGLLVSQRQLDLTGQNLTNASTPGYHRQVAQLAEINSVGASVGNGVSITDITRSLDQALEQAVTANNSASGSNSAQLNALQQLQSYLAPGNGTLDDTLSTLFTQLEALTTQPNDATQRQVVISTASALTTQLNSAIQNMQQLTAGLTAQAQTSVTSINALSTQIAGLNQQIQDGTIAGQNVNGLLDQRDQAVQQLSQLADVRVIPQPNGVVNVFAAGAAVVLGFNAEAVSSAVAPSGNLVVTPAGCDVPLDVTGGQLGGALTLVNSTLPAARAQLDTFARSLATQFDHLQATGLGLNGPMTALTSQRSVGQVNQPLAVTNLAFPPKKGSLYITVTNLATGQRTLNQVAIDPSTQSLSAVASAISAVPNIQAVVDPQSGQMQIMAAAGFGFDFTGNLSSTPDTQTLTGTTQASIDGQYTGTRDDTLTYTLSGAGTIGVTPNLTLQVTNSAGTVLGTLNVGQGYAPGSDLAGPLGINLNLSAGTVNTGDNFSVNATANPDSANLLTALGLNTFFVGGGAADLQVNPSLLNDSAQLANSTSAQPGDGTNLAKMVALQNQPVLANGAQSLQQYLEGLIGNVGTQVSDLQNQQDAYDSLGQHLNDQLQSATGVDTNEALMQLVQYQQSFQMAAKYITVVSQAMNALFNLPI